jgi:heme A synthase
MYKSNILTAFLYTFALIGLSQVFLFVPVIGNILFMTVPIAILWCIVYLMLIHLRDKIEKERSKDIIDL